MKDIIVNLFLSELVKNENIKKENIGNINPFTARSYNYAQNPNVIQKVQYLWQYLKNRKIYKIMKI